jgi:hypothetical protein
MGSSSVQCPLMPYLIIILIISTYYTDRKETPMPQRVIEPFQKWKVFLRHDTSLRAVKSDTWYTKIHHQNF